MAQVKVNGAQLEIQSVGAELADDSIAIGLIANGVLADPGATGSFDAEYLRRDGGGSPITNNMLTNFDVGGFDIVSVGLVDGRNISADWTTINTHIMDTGNPHATAISNLSDVTYSGSPAPATGEVLTWNVGGFWEPAIIPPGGSITLNDLTDVDTTGSPGAADGDVLTFDGSLWVPATATAVVAWGAITGTLSDQIDLQTVLDTKVETASQPTLSGFDIFIQKTGTDLEFRSITPSIGLEILMQFDGNNNIEIGIDEAKVVGNTVLNDHGNVVETGITANDALIFDGSNWTNQVINHVNLSSIGTNTHAQIDTHIAARTPHNNWIVANGGFDFAPGGSAGGQNAIALGNFTDANATQSLAMCIGAIANGTDSIAIGNTAITTGNGSVILGTGCTTNGLYSMSLGRSCDTDNIEQVRMGVELDNNYTMPAGSILIGIGSGATAAESILSLKNGGVLELIGAGAQFVQPNYTTAGLPAGILGGTIYDTDTNELKVYTGATWSAIGGTVSAWGGITGTLSDQTDLQTALDSKLNLTGGTLDGNLIIDTTSPTFQLIKGTDSENQLIRFGSNGDGYIGSGFMGIMQNTDNIRVRSYTGAVVLESSGGLFIMEATGNATVSGNAPINVDHLTRKDYVDLKETGLGNPTIDGQVLSSTIAGARTWITSDAGVTDHLLLTNIGTNTHAQIDTFITNTTAALSNKVETASQPTTAGWDIFIQKTGIDLEFRSIEPAVGLEVLMSINANNNIEVDVDAQVIVGNTVLNDIGNVVETGIAINDALAFDGTNWTNTTPDQLISTVNQIDAQITPRTDTIENLALITDAGDGEIATALNRNALVVYRGSPSVTQFNFINGLALVARTNVATGTYAQNVETALDLFFGNVSNGGAVNGAGNTIIMPSLFTSVAASGSYMIETQLSLVGTGFSSGANVDVWVEEEEYLTWEELSGTRVRSVVAGDGTVQIYATQSRATDGNTIANISRMRFRVLQDGAAAGNFNNSATLTKIYEY